MMRSRPNRDGSTVGPGDAPGDDSGRRLSNDPPALPAGQIACLPESPRTQVDAWDPRECVGTAHCPPRCPMFVDKTGRRVRVRPFGEFDREPLVAMYSEFPRAHVAQGLPPATEARIDAWLSSLLESGYNVVAEHDGTVLGHAVYTAQTDDEPELAVFVDPAHHDRGIGTELCKQLLAHAAAAGRSAIVLEVERSNRRAYNVYRRLGFETVDSNGFTHEMRLSLDDPIATALQRPPIERYRNQQ
ncbi:MAG: N-acetyltransferase family protein [Halobacteriota archaeon]